MSIERKKISVINSLVNTGVEKPYSKAERDAIMLELHGEDWKEHERMKAEGTLDDFQLDFEPEEEMEEWSEDQIQEDDPETEEIISNAIYGNEDEADDDDDTSDEADDDDTND